MNNEVSIADLTGKHFLGGVEIVDDGHSPVLIKFILDDVTYLAPERRKGQRSSLGRITASTAQVADRWDPIQIVGIFRNREGGKVCNLIGFYDVENGQLILEFGTVNSEEYYPAFYYRYKPSNMHRRI